MSQAAVIGDLLARRRDRTIAILLGFKDKEMDRYLPRETQAKFRKLLLDQLNEMFELSLDVLRSLDTGEVVVNELYLQRIDEIHRAVVGNGHAVAQH